MKYKEILDKIEENLEGNAHLDNLAKRGNNPFKILISTILSARTRDANTKEATETLFAKYKTPYQIAKAEEEELQQLIYKAGFYRMKAKSIKKTSKTLIDKYNGKVPQDFDKLMDLAGVGRKTANCVLVYAFQEPAIPVDTHVHRISNRLGWVDTKKPKETEKELGEVIPRDQWLKINRTFVKFGQQICLPNNPHCSECPIENYCPKIFKNEVAKKKKKKQSKK